MKPLFVFAPGAGAGSDSPWMQRYAKGLAKLGKVVPFDYEYRLAGRRTPDRLPKLIAKHKAALDQARKRHKGPVLLIGKSMGGRVGCHLAQQEQVEGLICLGYPLRGMGKNPTLRDEVLLTLNTPILFVQGTRDNLCPLDLLRPVIEKMTVRAELYVVETGNHSLEPTKTYLKAEALTSADVEARIMNAIADFVGSL